MGREARANRSAELRTVRRQLPTPVKHTTLAYHAEHPSRRILVIDPRQDRTAIEMLNELHREGRVLVDETGDVTPQLLATLERMARAAARR